jgi:hypothetical protein
MILVSSRAGSAGPTHIRGINPDLWRWLKAQAALEGKTIGQKLNEVLARERESNNG